MDGSSAARKEVGRVGDLAVPRSSFMVEWRSLDEEESMMRLL